jgi:hypothetical protein
MPPVYQLPLFRLEKRCTRCGLIKTIGEFPMQRRRAKTRAYFAFKPLCVECSRAQDRENWPRTARATQARARRHLRAAATEKRCSGCGILKALSDFYRDTNKASGVTSQCKPCKEAGVAARATVRLATLVLPVEKSCRRCGLVKPATAFGARKTSRDGLRACCNACRAADRTAMQRADRPASAAQRTPRDASAAHVRSDKDAKGAPRHVVWPQAEQQALAAQGLRRCTTCRLAKPMDAFYPTKSNRAGRTAACKECRRASVNARAAANNYAYGRAYYAENRERMRKRMRERAREKWRERSASNRAWRDAHPDQTRSYTKRAKARRRALLARVGGTHTAKDIRLLHEQQGGRCAYCRATLTLRYTIDHIVPLARGGSNDPTNLCIACLICNSSKGAKLLSEWLDRPYMRSHQALYGGSTCLKE